MPKATTATAQPGFFASIPASIYSPAFYAGVPQRSFWKGFWYLVRVSLILLLLGSIALLVPVWNNRVAIEDGIKKALNVYPEELVITLQNGQVSTNVEEPYFISIDQILPEKIASELESADGLGKNAVVIDTKTPFSEAQFAAYSTITWLGADAVYVAKDGGVEITSLAEAPDTVIDKIMMDGLINDLAGKIKTLIPAFAVISFIVVFVFVVVIHLIYLLFLSLLVLLMSTIMKFSLDYGASYKVALYGITLSLVYKTLVMTTSGFTGFNGFFMDFTLIALIVVALNLQKAKEQKLLK